MVDGHTTVGFRIRSTDCTKHGNDVGLLLPYKVHHRAAYGLNKSEVYNPGRYKHQTNRSAETNAAGFKGIGIECSNIGNIYN